MPNQRKANKKQVTLWVTPEEKMIIAKACEQSGLNASDLIKTAVLRMLIQKEEKHEGSDRQQQNND